MKKMIKKKNFLTYLISFGYIIRQLAAPAPAPLQYFFSFPVKKDKFLSFLYLVNRRQYIRKHFDQHWTR